MQVSGVKAILVVTDGSWRGLWMRCHRLDRCCACCHRDVAADYTLWDGYMTSRQQSG